MPEVKAKNHVESLSWRLRAARLDPNVTATEFVEILDQLIAAVRKESREGSSSDSSSEGT